MSALGVPRYLRGLFSFSRKYNGRIRLFPQLHDWYEEGGDTKGEYFWQDLYVAQQVFSRNPRKHVDIGSRIDGFVAHIASFREIEIFDIRPVTPEIPRVTFKQGDLMGDENLPKDYCDSLSCLHTLEHFGLGRYGDPIRPNGYRLGLENMTGLLKMGGHFYLSVPIGMEVVEFNAHRIFDPLKICSMIQGFGFSLIDFATVRIEKEKPLECHQDFHREMKLLQKENYSLGIFTFFKNENLKKVNK